MSTLLLAYDGSADAESAVRAAGALFPGAAAVVVTARRAPITYEHASEAALVAVPEDVLVSGVAALNEAAEQKATETAEAGERAAVAAGLAAGARIADVITSPRARSGRSRTRSARTSWCAARAGWARSRARSSARRRPGCCTTPGGPFSSCPWTRL